MACKESLLISLSCCGSGSGEKCRVAAAAGASPCPFPAADLGSASLRAEAELPWHHMALVGTCGTSMHLPQCICSWVMLALVMDRCTGWLVPSYTCAKFQWAPSGLGAAKELCQSKGWIFRAATLRPAFKLWLSIGKQQQWVARSHMWAVPYACADAGSWHHVPACGFQSESREGCPGRWQNHHPRSSRDVWPWHLGLWLVSMVVLG